MARRFRIHPSIGVARVGNSPDGFFIGPEQSGVPANFQDGSFGSFRDEAGRIKRQGARFRVFEYGDQGEAVEVQLSGDIVDIEWRVHIANRKSSFFTFNGQSGAIDTYLERSTRAPDSPEKEGPSRVNLRNAGVPADRREELNLDAGERVVSRAAPGPVVLSHTNQLVPFIPDLGEIRLDEAGRLVVLGGLGRAGSTANSSVVIDEYANNDSWFDDVGDGSVKARVRFANGTFVDADAAWVMVGPPDFAPTVVQAVTLYDLMWDVAVRELPLPTNTVFRARELERLVRQKEAWEKNGGSSLDGYAPSFVAEIYPILSSAVRVRRLYEPLVDVEKKSYHISLMNWEQLALKGDTLADSVRASVFSRIRNPGATEIDWVGMPRGLGDDYDTLDTDDPKPTALFSLTKIQYALLEQWAKGNFASDWPGEEPGIPPIVAPTPASLDRAALENCVGGPFFPGIEVSWLVRLPGLYAEPFRLDFPSAPDNEAGEPKRVGALKFVAGFFSQQMAQPWHADFFDCHKEEHIGPDKRPYYYMWWTAQRPDDTFAPGAGAAAPWVRHIVPPDKLLEDVESTDDRFVQMVANWPNLPFVLPNGQGDLEEEPR